MYLELSGLFELLSSIMYHNVSWKNFCIQALIYNSNSNIHKLYFFFYCMSVHKVHLLGLNSCPERTLCMDETSLWQCFCANKLRCTCHCPCGNCPSGKCRTGNTMSDSECHYVLRAFCIWILECTVRLSDGNDREKKQGLRCHWNVDVLWWRFCREKQLEWVERMILSALLEHTTPRCSNTHW